MFCDVGRGVDEKERDREEDENDMEDTCGYDKSGVRLV